MKALLALSAALVLFAAGCGDDDSGDSSPPADGGAAATAVDIKEFKFDPAETTVEVGQTITWTNSDSAAHNVVADDQAFESESLDQGDTFEYVADTAGSFAYVCTFHPQMKATLIVE